MNSKDVLDKIIASGRSFTVTVDEDKISYSVFAEEEGISYVPYEEALLPAQRIYEYTIWSLPVGSRKKLLHYSELAKKPRMKDYSPIYCGEIISFEEDDDLCEEIWHELNYDDDLWFAPCVSDVIQINGKFYYIDGKGFVNLPDFAQPDIPFAYMED